MSVVYGKRGLSDMEFWKQICRIEKNIIFLLLHDFGVKNRSREPDFFVKVLKFSEDDKEAFTEICEKYGIGKITDEFPEWLINRYRERILDTISSIKQNIRDANEVYPYYESEFYERRKYQDDAITLIEDQQRYGWLSDTAKEHFYDELDKMHPAPEPRTGTRT